MKKIFLGLALVLVTSLNFVGCIFGGEGDTSTIIDKKDSVAVIKTKSISPGFYVADYAWIDSGKAGWESEIDLNSDGTFRQFWIQFNEAAYEERGRWAQHDSSIHFLNRFAAPPYNGAFFDADYQSLTPDTNFLGQITDTSFNRLEYTPYRQKPYWIPYVKRGYPTLKNGAYQFTKIGVANSPTDTLPPADYTDKVKLEGSRYTNSFFRNQDEIFQSTAEWRQFGSFLVTEKFQYRGRVDTSGAFSPWDSLPGFIMFRLKQVSDNSFHMWMYRSSPDTSSWEVYRQIP